MLQIAKKAGMEKYVFHRPAHGEGMEGHQPPYIALGDATVLAEGMMFSNEPRLSNIEGGYGYNHSNNIVIAANRSRRMKCDAAHEGVLLDKDVASRLWARASLRARRRGRHLRQS